MAVPIGRVLTSWRCSMGPPGTRPRPTKASIQKSMAIPTQSIHLYGRSYIARWPNRRRGILAKFESQGEEMRGGSVASAENSGGFNIYVYPSPLRSQVRAYPQRAFRNMQPADWTTLSLPQHIGSLLGQQDSVRRLQPLHIIAADLCSIQTHRRAILRQPLLQCQLCHPPRLISSGELGYII